MSFMNVFKNFMNECIENLWKLKEKSSLWSVLEGNLPTRSSFAFKGWGGGGGQGGGGGGGQ